MEMWCWIGPHLQNPHMDRTIMMQSPQHVVLPEGGRRTSTSCAISVTLPLCAEGGAPMLGCCSGQQSCLLQLVDAMHTTGTRKERGRSEGGELLAPWPCVAPQPSKSCTPHPLPRDE